MLNKLTFKQRIKEYKNNPLSLFLLVLVLFAAVITVSLIGIIIAYILIN